MKGVEINLKGSVFELKFTLNVMCTYEDLTGKNALTTNIFEDISAKNIRNILFSYLSESVEDITLKDVGNYIEPDNIEYILTKMIEAYNKTKPEPSAEDKKKVNQLN